MERIQEYITVAWDNTRNALTKMVSSMSDTQILIVLCALVVLVVILLIALSAINRKRNAALDQIDQHVDELLKAKLGTHKLLEDKEREVKEREQTIEGRLLVGERNLQDKEANLEVEHQKRVKGVEEAKEEAQRLLDQVKLHVKELEEKAELLASRVKDDVQSPVDLSAEAHEGETDTTPEA